MRNELKKQEGQRKKFRATVVKYGKKINYQGFSEETILLKDITDLETQAIVADHVWFTYSKNFQKANIKEGAKVEFEARVKQYVKGYVNARYKINKQTTDYKLSHPTKIELVQG
jgi:hypothetical protein